jgi:hypothetical protein
MSQNADLRDQVCIVGIGETAYTRGTDKTALELSLEASMAAITDAGIKPELIDAVILPGGAGGGGTAGDFIANLGLPDLHYTTSLQEMGGAMCVAALECAATALVGGIASYALIPLCCRFYSGRKARQLNSDPGSGLQSAETIRDYFGLRLVQAALGATPINSTVLQGSTSEVEGRPTSGLDTSARTGA